MYVMYRMDISVWIKNSVSTTTIEYFCEIPFNLIQILTRQRASECVSIICVFFTTTLNNDYLHILLYVCDDKIIRILLKKNFCHVICFIELDNYELRVHSFFFFQFFDQNIIQLNHIAINKAKLFIVGSC